MRALWAMTAVIIMVAMTAVIVDLPEFFRCGFSAGWHGGGRGAEFGEWDLDPVRKGDRDALRILFTNCSPDAVRRRFFGRHDELPRRYLESVLASRPDLHDAVVARHRYAGHLAGLASLATGSDMGPEIAELGVLVVDAWQRQGLGTAMVEALVARGRQRGVQRVSACVLPDRARVLAALARRLQPERIVRTPHCLTGVYRLDAG
jgi:GNAT superfamily N-acetyltransferase